MAHQALATEDRVTRLAVARWYVDADTLGLAQVLIRVRPDVTFPGDDGTRHTARWTLPPCPVQQTGALDTEWIPKVAAAGMAIISRDRAISRRRVEKDAILAAGAQMFAITDPGQLRVWDLLDIVMTGTSAVRRASRPTSLAPAGTAPA